MSQGESMPRKSLKLRNSQTENLLVEYENAGLTSDRSYSFMQDMVRKMGSGKYPTSGQRRYLDSLIDQGAPSVKNQDHVNEILAAAKVDGMQPSAGTLHDFAHKVGKDWSLSEKQEKFLSNLLAKAKILKRDGRFRPTGSALKNLEAAVKICSKKNGWYWQHRPGTAKAYDKVRTWLTWLHRKEASDELEALKPGLVREIEQEPIIDEWACNKLLKAVKNQITELNLPKHVPGDMRWWRDNKDKKLVLISGEPKVINGEVTYPCLVDGKIVDVATGNLLKRRGS